MINTIVRLLVHSPFYPHWLEARKKDQATSLILEKIHGKVIEVGAGDGARKTAFLQKFPKITQYFATDYAEWDNEFTKINQLIQRFGKPLQIILGYHQRIKLDKKCDAMELPFKNNSFDYHLSFEVLEHISDPNKYFQEAARVVKKGGHIYVTVPFLYRMHGIEPDHRWDYYRYAFGFFHKVAADNNLTLLKSYSNTGYGTTWAAMTNQFVIRCMFEGWRLFLPLWFVVAPIIFFTTNVTGFLIDLHPDNRFATRFHILLRKNK